MPREVPEGTTHVVIEASDLVLLLEGIDLRDARRRPRWQPPAGADAPTTS
jgi:transposase